MDVRDAWREAEDLVSIAGNARIGIFDWVEEPTQTNFEKNSRDLHVLPVNLQQLGRQPVRGGNLDNIRI